MLRMLLSDESSLIREMPLHWDKKEVVKVGGRTRCRKAMAKGTGFRTLSELGGSFRRPRDLGPFENVSQQSSSSG